MNTTTDYDQCSKQATSILKILAYIFLGFFNILSFLIGIFSKAIHSRIAKTLYEKCLDDFENPDSESQN